MATKKRAPRRNISQRSELLYDIMEYDVLLDSREIFLHSISDNCDTDLEMGIDYRMADRFSKAMSYFEHQNSLPILIHVCSIGGIWEYGMAIFDRIAMSPCVVTTISYAHARSMSSILIQAADYRVLTPNCDFLVHFGESDIGGLHEHTIAEAKWAERISERMLHIYAQRCVRGPFFKRKKYTRMVIANFLKRKIRDKAEWYMTGREAIEYGFTDAILGDPEFETLDILRGG